MHHADQQQDATYNFSNNPIPLQSDQTNKQNTNYAYQDINAPFWDNITPVQDIQVNPESNTKSQKRRKKKEYTFITYMAADNDLARYARQNLNQQAAVGSTEYINVLVHLDTRVPGNRKVTKRFYIEKNKYIPQGPDRKMDSGNPETLIDCCRWAIKNFPAKKYVLVLWDHGSGTIDINRPRSINTSELFVFNPETNLIELDRSIPFLYFLELQLQQELDCDPGRGICFDDSTGNYITNQNLEYALKTICTKYLHGKKFSIIAFDACLMSMIEIANITKDYTDIVVASQEVEYAPGWRYDLVLSPFVHQNLDQYAFAQHMVNSYELAYSKISHDYTLSALNMHTIQLLEDSIDQVARLLIECLKYQHKTSVKNAIKTSRHKLLCTHFDEPSYVDLHHLLCNIRDNISKFTLKKGYQHLPAKLKKGIKRTLTFLEDSIIANTTGKNLKQARGISIYFPERRIHSSYPKTNFAKTNSWSVFIHYYLTH